MNKAIPLTHLNITFNIASMEASWPWFRTGDVVLSVLPFYHIYGTCNGVLLNVVMGIPFVFLPRFIPDAFLAAIDKYKISVSTSAQVSLSRADLGSLYIGDATCAPSYQLPGIEPIG